MGFREARSHITCVCMWLGLTNMRNCDRNKKIRPKFMKTWTWILFKLFSNKILTCIPWNLQRFTQWQNTGRAVTCSWLMLTQRTLGHGLCFCWFLLTVSDRFAGYWFTTGILCCKLDPRPRTVDLFMCACVTRGQGCILWWVTMGSHTNKKMDPWPFLKNFFCPMPHRRLA